MENPERVTYFAATDARGQRVPFGIKAKDRARHMYVIGKTGMGKSTMLENMAIQDIRNGEGLAFIDPHGSAVEKLLDFIPADRVDDVVYFAPFDLDNPVAFNIMEDVGYDKRHLVVSGLMATFKKIWIDAWSARMEYILTNTLLALLEYPGATLLGVNRMYTDKAYRKKVVDNVKDPVVKDFWTKEFANFGDKYTQEATPAIQNKIGQFTGNPLIRNIIGQPKSSFDIREMMDKRKILLMNLSKGLVGDTNMRLIGSMLTTRIFLGAMSRADLPAHELAKSPSFYFYVDEFQNFANGTFSEILSEARKYHLNLHIAHQYVAQMEEEVQNAVFGNVGTTVSFRVGPLDAELMEKVFAPDFTQEDLVNLGFAQIYLSLMIDGIGSRPFSAVTIPAIEAPARSFREEVIARSRQQFAAPRTEVEGAINAELAAATAAEGGPDEPRKDDRGKGGDRGPRGGQDRPQPRRQEGGNRDQGREDRRDRPERQGGDRDRRPAPRDTRSAEDLKAILRATVAASEREKQGKDDGRRAGIREAVSGATGPAGEERKPRQERPEPKSREPEERRNQEEPKRSARAEQPVFEVPEEALRALFKDV